MLLISALPLMQVLHNLLLVLLVLPPSASPSVRVLQSDECHSYASTPQSSMTTRRAGRPPLSTVTFCSLSTTSSPSSTRPNTTCLPLSQGVSAVVMKNLHKTKHTNRTINESQDSTDHSSSTLPVLYWLHCHPVSCACPAVAMYTITGASFNWDPQLLSV